MNYGDLLDRFRSLKAVVVGDLMLDEYIFGRATRISPEAPVMVIRQQSTSSVPGGAANVARNICALGARASIVGIVGEDAAGEKLEESLRADGGDVHLVRDAGRATTRKTRVLADHAHQVLRIDHEEDGVLDLAIQAQLIESAKDALTDASVLIMSDYLKGALSAEVAASLIAHAQAFNVPVVVNPKPRSLQLYKGATLVSLNRAEASEALDLYIGMPNEEAVTYAGALRAKNDVDAVLITLGEGGMAVGADSPFHVQAPKVEVYDTAGAGDTVVATVALGLASTGIERSVFELAAQTAASVVRKVGVATPSSDDLAQIRTLGG